MFDILEADIVCFQEVKTPKPALTDDLVLIPGWDAFYSFPHSQAGYSGVAVYTRDATCAPLRVEEGVTGTLRVPGTTTRYVDLPAAEQIGGYPTRRRQLRHNASVVGLEAVDSEGRCLVLEFPLFVLVNVYCPARRNSERTGFRNAFLAALDARVRGLAALGKNVVLCGDLNTMRDHIDTASVWGHGGQKIAAEALDFDETYLTLRAAKMLNQLLYNSRHISSDLMLQPPLIDDAIDNIADGTADDTVDNTADDTTEDAVETCRPPPPPVLYDACRELHPLRKGMYTCWDTRKNHRPANYGSRIDFVLCSPKIMQLVDAADIQPHLAGSDHCPVFVSLRNCVRDDSGEDDGTGKCVHILDYLNPPGRFVHGAPPAGEQVNSGNVATAAVELKRCAQSARQMPRFTNRRHIANMFQRAPKPAPLAEPATRAPPPLPSFGLASADANGSRRAAAAVVELPAVLRADPVGLVESSGEECDGEDDDVQGEEDEPSDEVVPVSSAPSSFATPNPNDGSADPEPRLTAMKSPPALLNSLHDEQLDDATSTAEKRPSPQYTNAGRDLTDPACASEQGKRPSPPPFSIPTSPTNRTLGGRRQPSAPAKPSAISRRPSVRSAGSGSSAVSSTRPAKKAKSTGFQTSINMFLQPRSRSPSQSQNQSQNQSQSQSQRESGFALDETEGPNTSTDTLKASDDGRQSESLAAAAHSAEAVAEWEAYVDETNKTARETWSRLGLGQRQVPLCEHGEPCKKLLTKKAGVNSGRSFYMCARPPGPLGRSEKGTAWQCPTFVWCRDWKPPPRSPP